MPCHLSVCTVCTPWINLEDLVGVTRQLGIHGLEIGIKDGSHDPRKPIDCWSNNRAILPLHQAERRAEELRRHMDQAGLCCPVLSTYLDMDHLDEICRYAGIAQKLGAQALRIRAPAPRTGSMQAQMLHARRSLREAARALEPFGVRLLLELHDQTLAPGASAALRLIEHCDPTQVGVIVDVANMIREGNEPLPMQLELLGPYVAEVHVKDMMPVMREAGRHWHRQNFLGARLGDGIVDWPVVWRCLSDASFSGWVAIENFADIERGNERLAEDVAFVSEGMASARLTLSAPRAAPPARLRGAEVRAIFLAGDRHLLARVYGSGREQLVRDMIGTLPGYLSRSDLVHRKSELTGVECIFTTWTMPSLTDDELACLPALKRVFYAAGTVQYFARGLLRRGIEVYSAWHANAIPVAESTCAHIVLAHKHSLQRMRNGERGATALPCSIPAFGMFESTVGLLALGRIGQLVAEGLQRYRVRVLAHDPFADPGLADRLGVKLVDRETLFRESRVLSVHLPLLPATRGSITAKDIELLPRYATIINTSRGEVFKEDDLWRVLRERTDLSAYLDVTVQEPPPPDSPIWDLPRVFYTPHICGSAGAETLRMADYMIACCALLENGRESPYRIHESMLETMA